MADRRVVWRLGPCVHNMGYVHRGPNSGSDNHSRDDPEAPTMTQTTPFPLGHRWHADTIPPGQRVAPVVAAAGPTGTGCQLLMGWADAQGRLDPDGPHGLVVLTEAERQVLLTAVAPVHSDRLGQLDTRLLILADEMDRRGATEEAAQIRTGCTYVREAWDGGDSGIPLVEALERIADHAAAMRKIVGDTFPGQYDHLTNSQEG